MCLNVFKCIKRHFYSALIALCVLAGKIPPLFFSPGNYWHWDRLWWEIQNFRIVIKARSEGKFNNWDTCFFWPLSKNSFTLERFLLISFCISRPGSEVKSPHPEIGNKKQPFPTLAKTKKQLLNKKGFGLHTLQFSSH